jgi:hypothetical protein
MTLQQQPVLVMTSLVAMLACGDNTGPSCEPERQSTETWGISGCPTALVFASRDTADLLPSQAEVDRYLDRWRRTIAAEPILVSTIPQRYRIQGSLTVHTTDPKIIAAWSQRVLETGDVELDKMLARIGVTLGPVRDYGSYFSAGLESVYIFNEEFLAAALLQRSSSMPAPMVLDHSDGTWVWLETPERTGNEGATAKINIRFGWGDCFTGCLGFRDLEAIVPPDGAATVYDLGGDTLPPHLSLSPSTRPPP